MYNSSSCLYLSIPVKISRWIYLFYDIVFSITFMFGKLSLWKDLTNSATLEGLDHYLVRLYVWR